MTKYKDRELKEVATVATTTKSAYEIERKKPIPCKNHAIVQTNLVVQFAIKYPKKFRALSEISIIIEDKERVPDIGIFKKLAYTPGNDDIRVSETPIGVVEILSPKQALGDLVTKSVNYFEAGVQSY
ncbi:MAG: Uma2 family endonuclease [Saprospiraceae bacterium]